MQFFEHVPLAPYTTFQIGGPARWFAEAANEDDIAAGVAFAAERHLPLFVLGGGSNLLVSDAGFSGLVLRIALEGISSAQENGRVIVSSAAGEDWDGLVAYAVGGTPVQNVGAYGQEVSQTIVTVRAFDRTTGAFVDLSSAACGFSYRRSIFNTVQKERYIVSRVDYALHENAPANFVYADLASYFAAQNQTAPTLAEVREAVRTVRAQKGMLLVAGNSDCRSAGSFFKNPIVPAAVLDSLAQELR